MAKKFFISTPIYYASGNPHIGHAYTTILADVINRYKKLIGYETFFITGMDEHGQKIETLAKNSNVSNQEFVDINAKKFQSLFNLLGIEYNCFIRTTNPNHIAMVQKIFSQMMKNDDIYLDQWKGYYCVSCEENYTIGQIHEKDGKLYCNVGHEIVEKNESSYFFRMSKYADWLQKFLKSHPNFVVPNHRINELQNNFLNNLTDLSISRTSITWGIPILENHQHVIYVWLDALFNYLSGLGYLSNDDSNYQKFWLDNETEKLHLMSKEITRFHCIYWPIFLKSLNLNLPTQILAHGWIITKEGKMSKSLGNVIDPIALVNTYSRDAFRYFLIKEIPIYRDGIFSYENFVETINSDLANNVGNLVNRTIGMLKKYTNGTIPEYKGCINSQDVIIEEKIHALIQNLPTFINNYQLDELIIQCIELIKIANKYIEDVKPWELYKDNKISELESLLTHLGLVIQTTILVLSPILIDGTKSMAEQMNIDFSTISLENCLDFSSLNGLIVNSASPIYTRYELPDDTKNLSK